MASMRLRCFTLLAVLLPAAAGAQEGFGADRLQPCLALDGLVSACRARVIPDRLVVAAGLDWAHHLLGIEPEDEHDPTRWLVEDRLTVRLEAGWAPAASLMLLAGLDAAVHQNGRRTDSHGARQYLTSAMGRSWIAALWAPTPSAWPLEAGLESRLVFPTASLDGLAGPRRVQWRLTLLLSTRVWLLRPVLNLGLAYGQDARFRDLTRDEALVYRGGLEIYDEGWPLAGMVEISGVTRLEAPFSEPTNHTAEALAGLRWRASDRIEVLVSAGLGLAGASSPAARGMLLIRWGSEKYKRPLENE